MRGLGNPTIVCGLSIFHLDPFPNGFALATLWGEGGLGGQNTVGTANWNCSVVTKDWATGKRLRMTMKFGTNF